jgi:hypothetical protein
MDCFGVVKIRNYGRVNDRGGSLRSKINPDTRGICRGAKEGPHALSVVSVPIGIVIIRPSIVLCQFPISLAVPFLVLQLLFEVFNTRYGD